MAKMTVKIGRDNIISIDLEYQPSGEAAFVSVPENTVTRAVFRFGEHCLDTELHPDEIWLDDNATVVRMKPGKITGLSAHQTTGYLTLFSADYEDGKGWEDYKVDAVEWPVCPVTE